MEEIKVARLDDLVPGAVTLVRAGDVPIVLARVGDAVHACGAVCAHRGGSLDQGRLTGHRLACPLHGWMYDVRTGQCVFPGRGEAVPSYPVRVQDGDVWVTA
jgi:nitrite reductase/ring-hydroxylating ferredoxin subunit